MPSRYSITFTGRVQGVGFRYSTCNVARRFDVTGWVRNEMDGSVKCTVEGDAAELDRFVEAVKQSMSGNIRDTRIERGQATGEFSGFAIEH